MAHDSPFHRPAATRPISRRDFLWQSGGGLGGLALAAMLGPDRALAAGLVGALRERTAGIAARRRAAARVAHA